MRSVPMNPITGEPVVRLPGAARLPWQAVLAGGVTGALVGSAVWALGRRQLGWYGVVLPIAGAGAGMLSWAAFERQAMR